MVGEGGAGRGGAGRGGGNRKRGDAAEERGGERAQRGAAHVLAGVEASAQPPPPQPSRAAAAPAEPPPNRHPIPAGPVTSRPGRCGGTCDAAVRRGGGAGRGRRGARAQPIAARRAERLAGRAAGGTAWPRSLSLALWARGRLGGDLSSLPPSLRLSLSLARSRVGVGWGAGRAEAIGPSPAAGGGPCAQSDPRTARADAAVRQCRRAHPPGLDRCANARARARALRACGRARLVLICARDHARA